MSSVRPFAALALALLLAGSACRSTPTGAAEGADDWIVLFDGTSLDAWRGFRARDVPAGWRIEDDALVRVASAGDLVTRERFGDFVLEFEWRVPTGGNSGVFYHVGEEAGATYETGPEYQILDNASHKDGLDPRTSAAANYALHAPNEDRTRPAGEWNRSRLEVEDGEVRHWLNGAQVLAFRPWTPEWRALVAASKFASMPAYGQAREGHIALQDHGDRVAFRNIRVRRLDVGASAD